MQRSKTVEAKAWTYVEMCVFYVALRQGLQLFLANLLQTIRNTPNQKANGRGAKKVTLLPIETEGTCLVRSTPLMRVQTRMCLLTLYQNSLTSSS